INRPGVWTVNNDLATFDDGQFTQTFDYSMANVEELSIVGNSYREFFNVASSNRFERVNIDPGPSVLDEILFFGEQGRLDHTKELSFNVRGGAALFTFDNRNGPAFDAQISNYEITGVLDGSITFFGTNSTITTLIGSDTGDDRFEAIRTNDPPPPGNAVVSGPRIEKLLGLGGDDVFDLDRTDLDLVDGGEGSDAYLIRQATNIIDSGTTGFDEVELRSDLSSNNQITLDDASYRYFDEFQRNLEKNLQTTFGTITLTGSTADDTFHIVGSPVQTLDIESHLGNDEITVNSPSPIDLQALTGEGDDTITIGQLGEAGTVRVYGESGNDVFSVSSQVQSDVVLDGGDDNDHYRVQFIGGGFRRTQIIDDSGMDSVSVLGTFLADNLVVRENRVRRVSERISIDQQVENLIVQSLGNADTISIQNPMFQNVSVYGNGGDDKLILRENTGNINLGGGSGNDTFNIHRTSAETTINVYGDEGNDLMRVGMGSERNLDNFAGMLNFFGGGNLNNGHDQLIVDDSSSSDPFHYDLGTGQIRSVNDSNESRESFGSIQFNSTVESIRLNANHQANTITVTASQFSQFHINGNGQPNNGLPPGVADILSLNSQPDLTAELVFTQIGDSGFYNIVNRQNVSFVNIEVALPLD
ncbi:MAG: hypothetical protein AAGA30_08035, partial [Planctomycetota bacterium]